MAYQSFVDHSYSALPKINYGPVEGMGDFAADVGTRSVGPEISKARRAARLIKGAGARGITKAAMGPLPLVASALAPVAQATAAQAVQSGQYTEPGALKALPGTFPGRAIDTRGISNTNPFTGGNITNYQREVQPDRVWSMPTAKPNVAPWVAYPEDWSYVEPTTPPNSLPALPQTPALEADAHGFATINGKRVNYTDIGKGGKGSLTVLPPEPVTPQVQGATALNNILNAVQGIQPVQGYAGRVSALNRGNTTWDMNSLDKILAAKADQAADESRFTGQVGALSNLGAAQMNADAARYGADTKARTEEAQNAYLAPYYKAQGEKAQAEAKAAPLTSVSNLIENQKKYALSDKDRLEQAVKILNQFGATIPTDPSDPSYELYHNAKDTFDYLTSKRK